MRWWAGTRRAQRKRPYAHSLIPQPKSPKPNGSGGLTNLFCETFEPYPDLFEPTEQTSGCVMNPARLFRAVAAIAAVVAATMASTSVNANPFLLFGAPLQP